ncbi:MAG: 16S rRNA (guanine(527)-N(7))-methyltransferase RsmG [Nitrospirae bacterium CG_4_9_14_3_um_filter_53_35]|nr:MAG: 16S rRNA (guanine(527)-N(7))-methyltransferase RsmG [Nitrospirae bacterium CG08_land_8_20_14_0_20_52_24]PIV85590.1 MAG: 16S rRNA (guanine(527)-N(7))-methyltransferase RsmG [Nitrospirae bacterium CG17_big_fil_post_rev_8_21_14_2_50_50_9]PIW85640.1 MAG: 16S rRNA (guanine(527)-N(7))-methyltransferase RsmG [Nitrospirae bacterium CG_4_8_14_3_um_filter_50_41]PIX87054.1 MAG: 16S rRNA (guanine(527)-N(7))-methyltransferase RsmG [Nitrospirae bacterium CG_4_10_14_3_um_filter_53_41]PJA77486.1 MAG: 1
MRGAKLIEQRRLLVSGVHGLGLKIGKKELSKLDLYTQTLLEWSNRINLTGHRDQERIEIFHYLDSLSLFETGEIHPGLSVLDVGSGAGFPGLPLRIFEPALEMTLLESSGKKGFFLRYLVRILELPDVKIEIAQAKDFTRETEASFDRIVCRAVGSLFKVCSWTVSLLKPGGLFLFQKSRKVDTEIQENKNALQRLGLTVREAIPLSVPYLDRPRYAVIIEKIKK